MHDWNVVVTVHEGGFTKACRLLEQFGPVRKTDFFNILVLHADEPLKAMELLHARLGEEPAIASWIARFMPLARTFTFQSVQQFEARARETVSDWLPRLAGARFHLRMHRRGFKGKLSSAEEERFLDTFLLERLAEAGTPGKVAFDDPDAIIALETLGPRAGLSLWGREELARFPLLHLD
jgi:tRNA(Ser,Leu) C12 N-acetylase TAN1